MFSKIIKLLAKPFKSRVQYSKFIELNDPRLSTNERARRFRSAYNARRGLPRDHLPHERLSRDDIARIVDAPFDDALVELGFERVSHKLWVRRNLAPICHLFSLERYGSTGFVIAPSFGLSLDFVPHVAAGKIRWHRTAKSARYDLERETQSRWFRTDDLGPPEKVEADVRFMLPRALKMANDFWDNAKTLGEVSEIFARYAYYAGIRHKTPPSKLDKLLIRPSPAEAFLTAKNGNISEARLMLERWLEVEERTSNYRFDPGVPERLRDLLKDTALL